MSAAAILILIEKFGPPAITLVEFLIAKAESNGAVSGTEWATQMASLRRTATDEMLDRLKAAGIDPASAQGVALIAATK